jgi:hypothetical protein
VARVILKFRFSEKTTKFRKNLPLVLTLLGENGCFVKTGWRFFLILWRSHNVLTLKHLNLLFLRADEAEKKRKDLENATNFNDEHIEKSEADLRLSKKTMRETHEKYDETGIKLILFYKQYIMKIVFCYQNCSNLL